MPLPDDDHDAQLAKARELLDELRQAGAHVHAAVQAQRDAWGGLGLFLQQDVADDELLLRIPRDLMLQPPATPAAGSDGDGVSQTAALASRLALLAEPGVADGSGDERLGGAVAALAALWQIYVASLPGPTALADVLPALWVLGPWLQATDHERCSSSLGATAPVADAVRQRAQHLRSRVRPSPSSVRALRQQLEALGATADAADALGLKQVLNDWRAEEQEGGSHAGRHEAGAGAATLEPLVPSRSAAIRCWAQGVAWSRAIHLWAGPTLVPGFDFINHHAPPNVVCMARTQVRRARLPWPLQQQLLPDPSVAWRRAPRLILPLLRVCGTRRRTQTMRRLRRQRPSSQAGGSARRRLSAGPSSGWRLGRSCTGSTAPTLTTPVSPLLCVARWERAQCQQRVDQRVSCAAPHHPAGWLCSYGFVPGDGVSSYPAPVMDDPQGAGDVAAPGESQLAAFDEAVCTLQQEDSSAQDFLALPPGLRVAVRALLERERAALAQLHARPACAAEPDASDASDAEASD